MHTIEPFYNWRELYVAEEDERSPFYGTEHSEFQFSNTCYNYYIHPQWDSFGSTTLYMKLLFTDYEEGFAIIELMGEWNDALHNDIMFLKKEIIEPLMKEGVFKFMLIAENVLNFHSSDDCYYEEWLEEVMEEGGWIIVTHLRDHVVEEMRATGLHHHMLMTRRFDIDNWRNFNPMALFEELENRILKPLTSGS